MEAEKSPIIPAPVEEMVKLHRGISTTSPMGYPEASTPQAARGLTWVPSPTAEGMVPVTPTARYPALPSMLVRRPLPNVKVSLENAELWRKFHKIGTEMIITKTGRRMFPPLQVSVSGLNPDSEYYFLLELAPVTSEIPSINGRTREVGTSDCASSRPSLVHRLRFSGKEWVVAGRGEAQAPTSSRIYVHPDSPAHGSRWMKGFGRRNDQQEQNERNPEDEVEKEQKRQLKKKHIISFSKVKLTNNSLDGRGHVVLTSMHKYIPRIHIVKASDYVSLSWGPEAVFSFPETEFVAVTAYQNGKITKLKIDHNPFAKGFRENGMSKSKRKLDMMKDSDDGGNSSDEELSKLSCLDCNNNGNSKRIRTNSVQSTSIESVPSRSPTSSPGSTVEQSFTADESADIKTRSAAQEPTNSYFPFLWASFAQQTGLQMTNYDQRYFPYPMLPNYSMDPLPNLAHRGIFPYHTPSLMSPPLWKMPFLYPSHTPYYGLSGQLPNTYSHLPLAQMHFSPPSPYPQTKVPSIQESHPYLLDLSSKNA